MIPGFDSFCRTVYSQVRIPTHDEWPGIFTNSEPSQFKDKVYSVLHNSPGDSNLRRLTKFVGITDPAIISLRSSLQEASRGSGEMIRLFQS